MRRCAVDGGLVCLRVQLPRHAGVVARVGSSRDEEALHNVKGHALAKVAQLHRPGLLLPSPPPAAEAAAERFLAVSQES